VQAYGSRRAGGAVSPLGNALGGGSAGRSSTGTPRAAARTYWAGDHTNALAFGAPLLVMDMYEHAYAMDYGLGKDYIDAFFKNINWPRSTAASGMGTRPVVLICRHDPPGVRWPNAGFDYAGSMAHGHQPRAVGAGFFALVRDKEISWRNGSASCTSSHRHHCLTGFGSSARRFGKPHALGIITLVALVVAGIAGYSRVFGRISRQVEIVSYSATFLFHWIPAVTETTTRCGGAPLFPTPKRLACKR